MSLRRAVAVSALLTLLLGACHRYAPLRVEAAAEVRAVRVESRASIILIGETPYPPRQRLVCHYRRLEGSVGRVARDTIYLASIATRQSLPSTPRRCVELRSGAVLVDGASTQISNRRLAVGRTIALATVGTLAFLLMLFVSGDDSGWGVSYLVAP